MNQEQKFINGFNNGYLLAKHDPELIKKLLLSKNDNNEYYKGIAEGKKQYDIEKVRERLKSISSTSKNQEKGIIKVRGR